MSICLAIFTDGRKDCISQTIPSAEANLVGDISKRVIFDDSADPAYARWLWEQFPKYTTISNVSRRGFGGNIRDAWKLMRAVLPAEIQWIFHLEDDFTFNRPVNLVQLRAVLDLRPQLKQMAMRRQPWNEAESTAGGVVEQHPEAYEDCALELADSGTKLLEWLEHRLCFTTNPCIYHRSLLEHEWPDVEHSEGIFTHQLLVDPNVRFGYWGKRSDPPWVTHIGRERVGIGY